MLKMYEQRIPVKNDKVIDNFELFEKMAEQNEIDCALMLATADEQEQGIFYWILYFNENQHAVECLVEIFKYRLDIKTRKQLTTIPDKDDYVA